MDRRTLIVSGLVTLGAAGVARAQPQSQGQPAPPTSALPQAPPPGPAQGGPPPPGARPDYPANKPGQTYSREEIVSNVSDFLGVTAEAAGGAIERIFKENGRPSAYIAGEEGSGAFAVGARAGRGLLYMKEQQPLQTYWIGPSIGWDVGGNASRVFTLCYNLWYPERLFQRFPGVEGSAYLVGGLGVNYQRADDITLAPIRAGVGLRLGANIGYLAYSRKRSWIPF